MKLFQEESGILRIDSEAKLIAEFKEIWDLDPDKRKRNALKEFAYIYFMSDVKSPYIVYTKDERKVQVREAVGLPDGWKHTKLIDRAISRYMELSDTPSKKALRVVRETLVSTVEVVHMMNEAVTTKMKLLKKTQGDIDAISEEEGIEPSSLLASITELTQSVNELLTLSKKLPEAITSISNLEKAVSEESKSDSKIRGGGTRGHYED